MSKPLVVDVCPAHVACRAVPQNMRRICLMYALARNTRNFIRRRTCVVYDYDVIELVMHCFRPGIFRVPTNQSGLYDARRRRRSYLHESLL